MSSDIYYNPAIEARLNLYIGQCDWQGVLSYLGTLSHSHFRTAGHILGRLLAAEMVETDVWPLSEALVRYNAKAFLGTVLKALGEGLNDGRFHLRSQLGGSFWQLVKQNPVDAQKTLQRLLPLFQKPEDVAWLLHLMGVEEGEHKISYLLRVDTMPARFQLLHALRYVENDRQLLIRVVRFLMKRGDAPSFSLASLLCTLYGLKEEVKGTFSLRLEPYQLARVEQSYEAFCEAMK